MNPVFVRATAKIRDKLGEQARLNGSACGSVVLHKGVHVDAGIPTNGYDNPIVPRDIASFDPAVRVEVGAILDHPDGRYRVDALMKRDQYTSQWLLVGLK
jgi:hypothetical protein